MKKNILTLMFVLAFVFGAVSVASAKTPTSASEMVTLSKRVAVAAMISKKIKELKAKCKPGDLHCAQELTNLLLLNEQYEDICFPFWQYICHSFLENLLLGAASRYEMCMAGSYAKNIDKTIDRKRRIRKAPIG